MREFMSDNELFAALGSDELSAGQLSERTGKEARNLKRRLFGLAKRGRLSMRRGPQVTGQIAPWLFKA